MNKCRDCFHWLAPSQTRFVVLYPDAGECRNGALAHGDPKSKVYLEREDKTPYLACGPDFGCVHWEPK